MEKIRFRKKLFEVGGSTVVIIPKEMLEYLDAKNGDELTWTPDEGKHGKYAALFKEGR